jgi:hypothetical protein
MMPFLLCLLAAWLSNDPAAPCLARIDIQRHDGMLTITGHCRNQLATAGRYRYELATERQSQGNRSQNLQRGEFSLAPNQDIALSQTQINTSPRDAYRISLHILDLAGHTVAQDSAIQVAAQ